MSNTTQINQVDELTSVQFLSYIRPIELKLTAFLLKPNTRYNLFFDGVNVNNYTQQETKLIGEPLISDANGIVYATLFLPGFKFTAGQKKIVITQESTVDIPAGSNVSRADATFVSYSNDAMYDVVLEGNTVSVNELLQKDIIIPVQPQVATDDALAQSFFTYGVDGGIFVTSIELFFKEKDNFLPVWVEIREMINGYPSKNFVSPEAIAYKNAADVLVSATAASATKFTFDKLLYLPQDREFCFVVRSRSNNYTLWTSRIGELSNENNKIVSEQPYTGSLFKTDNNVTWSVEQFEDIKFVLNRADFNTSVIANLRMPINALPVVADGTNLKSMVSSNVLVIDLPQKHGLDTNSKATLKCDTAGKYNGVSGTLLNGTFNVLSIITDFAFAVNIPGATFTETGPIRYGGRIKNIAVANGGSGYSSSSLPTVTISAPNETGTQATAVAVVENDKVVRIDITNPGTGYTGPATVTITGGIGTGATAIIANNATFGVLTNRVFNSISPTLSYNTPPKTTVTSTLETTTARFENGVASNYVAGDEYKIKIGAVNDLDNHLLIATKDNETANMGGNPSCIFEMTLASENRYVSPILDTNNTSFVFHNNRINELLADEDVTSTASTGTLQSITVTSGGSGYTVAPTVQIYGGRNAKAKANISGGAVTSVTIINPGTGFFAPPVIYFSDGNPTTVATATAAITPYNSELLANNGSAATKYITKPQVLDTPSTAIRMFVTAYSNKDSSFEVYIKRSLTSENTNHESTNWVQLSCDVTRNKSDKPGQELEYEFYADDLPLFDVYSLKIVLRSVTPWDPPYVSSYRAIVLA
jgi:hypothetical protein